MEGSLKESLHHIRIRKETLGKYQLMPLECTSQSQAGMHLLLMMSGMQEAQPMSCLPNSENQHMIPLEPNFLPQRDVECSNNALSTYSAYLASGKLEVGNTGHLDNTEQEVDGSSGLRTTDCLSLQLNEHFPYYAYNGLNFPEAKKLKPEMEMNLQGNCLDYQTNRTFEMPRQTFDNVHHTWVSSSNPCAIAMFNEDSYQQQPH